MRSELVGEANLVKWFTCRKRNIIKRITFSIPSNVKEKFFTEKTNALY